MSFTATALVLAGMLFVGMLALQELGRRLGQRRQRQDPEGSRAGAGAVEGPVFALLGLLIAFTFSGAATRFDARRQLVTAEANAIGTAYLRLDLLPKEAQPALRELFRRYLDSRLETYRKAADLPAAMAELANSARLQNEVWTAAVEATRFGGSAQMLVLPALNQMIDITTTRTTASEAHPPAVIFGLLFALALACSVIAGYSMAAGASRSWTHMLGLAAVMAVTIYVILDIEYPRLGLIRVDGADHVLVELRQSMK